ncbi:restriction endonuclease subunit S [Pontibacter arcticus]|nr:restriction endonuclease subunit S [Pontibacter arcticus]
MTILKIGGRIGEILKSIDDKIELNRRMNQTLEQMAQTLFRQYFVDGIDEENLPEGWKIGKLSDVSKNVRMTANPKDLQEECKYVGLEHIPRKSIALTDWSTSAGVESQKYRFEQNHILFGKLRPYFHKVILAPFEGICSTDILVIEPLKDYMLAFCLLHYSSEEVVQYSNQLSHGTRMPRADWKGLSGYEIAIPPKELFIKFNNLILPSLQKIKTDIEEIQTLTQLRDTLLPKLMSGEIDVMQTKPEELHEPVLS